MYKDDSAETFCLWNTTKNKSDQKIFMNSQNLDLLCCIYYQNMSRFRKGQKWQKPTVCHFFPGGQ